MKVDNKQKIAEIKKWLGNGSINIFGRPYSGKDTHGKELAKTFGGVLVGGGDILRSREGLDHIREHIAKGFLAPTDEYLEVVLPYLSQKKFKSHPLIMSSVGRWDGEQEAVTEAALESGHQLKAVIHLKISEDESLKRWQLTQRGRHDDMDEHVLLTRFSEYKEKTLPVIGYYRQAGLLIELNGEPPIAEVSRDIIDQLWRKSQAFSVSVPKSTN